MSQLPAIRMLVLVPTHGTLGAVSCELRAAAGHPVRCSFPGSNSMVAVADGDRTTHRLMVIASLFCRFRCFVLASDED